MIRCAYRTPIYHSGVPATCPHGLPPSQCLICPTLPRPAAADVPSGRSGSHIGFHLVGVAAAVVVLGLAAWALAGVVFGLLHVLELVAVGAAAAWAGYRIGHVRGSRQHR